MYFKEGDIASTGNALVTINSIAVCDPGDIVLHGNYNINKFGGNSLFNIISSTSSTFDFYSVTVRGNGATLQNTALCFNNP